MEMSANEIPAMALYVASKGSETLHDGVTFIDNGDDGCVCKYLHPTALDLPGDIKNSIQKMVYTEPSFHWIVFKTFSRVVVYKVDRDKVKKERQNAAAQTIQGWIQGTRVRLELGKT